MRKNAILLSFLFLFVPMITFGAEQLADKVCELTAESSGRCVKFVGGAIAWPFAQAWSYTGGVAWDRAIRPVWSCVGFPLWNCVGKYPWKLVKWSLDEVGISSVCSKMKDFACKIPPVLCAAEDKIFSGVVFSDYYRVEIALALFYLFYCKDRTLFGIPWIGQGRWLWNRIRGEQPAVEAQPESGAA